MRPPLLLEVIRDDLQPDFTRGTLTVDGLPCGFTCEDTDRGLVQTHSLQKIAAGKIRGRTAIPLGTYTVALTYSPKYKRIMPLVCEVPGFRGIRIHSGNSAADTEGCLLVGTVRTATGVGNSRVGITALNLLLQAAVDAGRAIRITYRLP